MPDAAERPAAAGHEKYQRLIKAAQAEATIKVAVAHPCDYVSLEGAVEAARLHLIEPILVGPEERILTAATRAGLDISAIEIVRSGHSHEFGGEGGRTGDRRTCRGADEGKPPH